MKTTKMLAILVLRSEALLSGVVLVLVLGLTIEVANADFTFGEPTNLGPPVNSGATDCFSTISWDGLELYLMDPFSPRPGGLGGWDIWVTKRPSTSEPWGTPVNLGPFINSESDDAKPSISADGLTLYFGSTRPGGHGGYDLWMSTRTTITDDWSEPVNLGPTINSASDEAFSCISKDGLELYFSGFGIMGRPGGYGDADIWVTTRATVDDPWGEPVNLGEAVNTPDYDSCPYLSPDGLVLFLHSFRPGGPGGEDMWVTTRPTTSDAWGSAVPLPTPINSTANEGAAGISTDGFTFYFVSTRAGGEGGQDIWQAPIIPIVDLNGDGIVEAADICIMVDHWGTDESLCDIGPMPWGDGIVDVQDLVVLAEHFFTYPGALAYWKLDEAEGNIAQDSANDNDGSVHGDPAWQPEGGMVDGALQLDGIDDYVSTPFVLNPADGEFNVFVWIKGGAPGQAVLSQEGGANWLCADALEGNLMTELKGPGRSDAPMFSQANITDGNWHHIGLVWDGSHRTLYVDDVAVAETTQGGLEGSEGGLYIGAGKNLEPGSFFSGLIDDVCIRSAILRTGSTTGR
jgi:hypothetical protein